MVKNIIFDFGGVFINIRKIATEEILSIYQPDPLSQEVIYMNEQYERGDLSTTVWLDYYQKKFPQAPPEKIIHAWKAIVLDFPEYRLNFIEELAIQRRFRLFLLSNTNELHIEQVKKNMGVERFERFKRCFEKFYLSYEIGLRKPDSRIYEYVIAENQLRKSETLFIDDDAENTAAARLSGIQAWLLLPGEKEDVTMLFKNHKLTGILY